MLRQQEFCDPLGQSRAVLVHFRLLDFLPARCGQVSLGFLQLCIKVIFILLLRISIQASPNISRILPACVIHTEWQEPAL